MRWLPTISFIVSWGHTLTPVPNTGDLFTRWLPCAAACLTGLETSRKCRYFTSRSPGKPWSETSANQNQNFWQRPHRLEHMKKRCCQCEREMSAWGSCPRQVLWTGVPGAQGHVSSALKGLSTSPQINALSYFFGPQLGLWCVLPMSLVDGWANHRVLLLWQTLH